MLSPSYGGEAKTKQAAFAQAKGRSQRTLSTTGLKAVQKQTTPAVTSRRTKWKEMFTETGDKYYWNEETGASEWEIPQEEKNLIAREKEAKDSVTTRCAFSGCTNQKFSGKQYCVSHMTSDSTAKTSKVNPIAAVAVQKLQSAGTKAATTTAKTAAKTSATMGTPTKTIATAGGTKTTATSMGTGVKANANTTAKTNTTGSMGRAAGTTVAAKTASTGIKSGAVAAAQAKVAGAVGAKSYKPPNKKQCDWTKEFDANSGYYYYYNYKTQESLWEEPPDYVAP